MKKINTLLFLLGITLGAFGQTSIIQDKSGETSLNMKNKIVYINSGDASIGANLSFYKVDVTSKIPEKFWGLSLKLKANDGVAALLDGYNFQPKFSFGFFKGAYIPTTQKKSSTNYYYGVELNNSYFNLINPSLSNIILKSSFFSWKIKTGINRLGTLGTKGTLLGFSIELGRYNNLDDLTSTERYKSYIDTSTVPATIALYGKKNAFTGEYKENMMVKINADYLIYTGLLNNQLAVGGYIRANAGGSFSRQNAGLGVFLGTKGAPDKIILGIVYQVNDVFNQLGDEPSYQKRSGINITAGYNF